MTPRLRGEDDVGGAAEEPEEADEDDLTMVSVAEGVTPQELAEQLGVGGGEVVGALMKMGIPVGMTAPRNTPQPRQKMKSAVRRPKRYRSTESGLGNRKLTEPFGSEV